MRLPLGIFVLFCTVLAMLGQLLSRDGHTVVFPTVSWVFTSLPAWQPWLGAVLTLAFGALGVWLVSSRQFQVTPMTARKLKRFGEIGRGVWSFRILMVLVALACLDQALVGRRALAVKHEGQWYFPAFRKEIYPASTFGLPGEAETDYRKLAELVREKNDGRVVVLPLIPWDPVSDTDPGVAIDLQEREGKLLYPDGQPFSGLAQKFTPGENGKRVWQARFREGVKHLTEEAFAPDGKIVYSAKWEMGRKIEEKREEGADAVFSTETGPWQEMDYPPIAPNFARRHYLGTDGKGWDVAAQLFGGFQVILKAAALYLLVTYVIGTSLGLLMGFWGGVFDLIMQRLIEILSSIPFLYLVIILVSIMEKENITLPLIIGVFCLFSWIGCSYYMRSATYREKARDYVAAARVMGAGPGRIIFKHILPNTIALLVTLIPFSITGISSALTSLDFIGFGLPEKYASWGRLLGDGVENLRTAPWIVSSVFVMIVFVLLLVTFVGEALREAFDPKKFTTYR
jgi:microcin C transport system permease protein